MTFEEKVAKIKELVEIYLELDSIYSEFYIATNSPPDSPLFKPVFKLLDKHIETISAIVGDKSDWLSWYIFDNNCGYGDLAVQIAGEEEKKVESVEELVKLIEG